MKNYPEEARKLILNAICFEDSEEERRETDKLVSQLCELVRESIGEPLDYKKALGQSKELRLMLLGGDATERVIRTKWTLKEEGDE